MREVHEEPKLVVEVKFRVDRLAEAHPVALALLVQLALVDDKGGAVLLLGEAFEEIRVKLQVAGGGLRALPGAHAADAEGARGQFVAELEQVLRLVAEESHDHVASDAQLVGVLSAEQAAQGPDEAGVRHGAGDRRREASGAVVRDDSVDHGFERRFGGAHRREVPEHGQEYVVEHGQELWESAAGQGPREAGAPVSRSLDAGRRGRAEGGNDGGEGLGS